MLPFPPVIHLYIPWDFVLVLLLFATILPWRGTVRIKRLLNKPDLSSSDRLSLYVSTILFQWLLVVIVFLDSGARTVSFEELGIATSDPWRIAWTSVVVVALLCTSQIAGLRKAATLPQERRGSLLAITQRIMPRTGKEILVYSALACTAGISEEFLYRGFVFMAFFRMLVNYGPANVPAAVLSSAWFSLAHLYQGKRGLITTFVVGMIFVSLRIWTGSLIPAILGHIAIDLTIGIVASKLFLQEAEANVSAGT